MQKTACRASILAVVALSMVLRGPTALACLGSAEPSYWDSLAAADRVVVAEVQSLRAHRSLKTRAGCWLQGILAPSHQRVVRLGHRIDRGLGLLAEEHWPEDSSCFIPRDLYARLRVEVDLKGEGTPWPRVMMTEGTETFLVPGERLVVLLRGGGLRWRTVGTYRSALLARDADELGEVTAWVRDGLARQAAGAERPPAEWSLRALTLPTLSLDGLPEFKEADLDELARRIADFQILGGSLALAFETFQDRPDARVDAALAQWIEVELATARNSRLAENMMQGLLARIGALDTYTELAAERFSDTVLEDSRARWREAKRRLSIAPADNPDLLRRHLALGAWRDSLFPRWREATAAAEETPR